MAAHLRLPLDLAARNAHPFDMNTTEREEIPDSIDPVYVAAAIKVPMTALPRGARIWVFASTRPLDAADEARLSDVTGRVFGVWTKRSPGVRGAFEFREGRFLIVGADEREALVSGCGVDAMMHWMRQLEAASGLRLVDRMQVFWREGSGAVRSAHRVEFKRLLDQRKDASRTCQNVGTSASLIHG